MREVSPTPARPLTPHRGLQEGVRQGVACSTLGHQAVQHQANLIRMIQNLYDKATSAVYLNNSLGDWLRTAVGVRQGCVLSPTLLSMLLERIMTDALNDHGKLTNLHFADDIDGLAGREEELADLVECLDKTSTAFGMQINAEKTKLMTNNTNYISTDIGVNGEKVNCVNWFKYMPKHHNSTYKIIWNDRNKAFSSNITLMHSLVMSIFLYACESWTVTAGTERRIQAMEIRCLRKLIGITYRDYISNEEA